MDNLAFQQSLTDLIRRETEVPDLANLIDTVGVAAKLGVAASELTVDYVRYKPHTSALVRYTHAPSGQPTYFYGRSFAKSEQHKLRSAKAKTPTGAPEPRILSGYSLLYAFPQDARLRTLWKATSKFTSSRMCLRLGITEAQIQNAGVMAYKPERRCVLRCSGPSPITLKLYTAGEWSRAYVNARFFQTVLPQATVRVNAKSRRYSALSFDYEPGSNLRQVATNHIDPQHLRVAAVLLAELHSPDAPTQVAPAFSDHNLAVQTTCNTLGWLLPELRLKLEALQTRLINTLGSIRPLPGLVHGDFYDKQIIVNARRMLFIDFDQAGVGDVRMDVANFVAHRILLGPEFWQQEADLFLSAYVNARGAALPHLKPFIALCLLKLSHHPFRSANPNWHLQTERLLQQVSELLNDPGVNL